MEITPNTSNNWLIMMFVNYTSIRRSYVSATISCTTASAMGIENASDYYSSRRGGCEYD